MAGKTCQGEHSGHICVLASNDKFEEIKALTKPNLFVSTAEGPPIAM